LHFRPEGPQYNSPGQRPGSRSIENSVRGKMTIKAIISFRTELQSHDSENYIFSFSSENIWFPDQRHGADDFNTFFPT